MRAISLSEGVEVNRVVEAVKAEIDRHMRERGTLKDSFLILEVRVCLDEFDSAQLIGSKPSG